MPGTGKNKRDWIFWIALVLVSGGGASGARAEPWAPSDVGRFIAGGLTGFVIHETAHAAVAESLGLKPRLEFRRKPVPFVVVDYDWVAVRDPSGKIVGYIDGDGYVVDYWRQKRFAIASAGFNSQNLASEWILSVYPHLREESRPFLKGMLTFDILTSVGYALVGRKDHDGDVRGMSEALNVNDWTIAGIVALPAALDLYRYYHPESVWIPWMDRGAKAYLLGLSFRF